MFKKYDVTNKIQNGAIFKSKNAIIAIIKPTIAVLIDFLSLSVSSSSESSFNI